MAVITFSRQVAALGDEVAGALAKKLGYNFITRKEIEKRIVELGFPENKMPKFDERKPGFFASLTKDRDEYLNYAQYAILEAAEKKNVVIIGRGSLQDLQYQHYKNLNGNLLYSHRFPEYAVVPAFHPS